MEEVAVMARYEHLRSAEPVRVGDVESTADSSCVDTAGASLLQLH